MSQDSPAVILYDANGVAMAVEDGVATPAGSRGVLVAGKEGSNTRFMKMAVDGAVQVDVESSALPTNAAQETGGNLATLTGKDFATQTTLALIKAKTDNIDVAFSARTKPADQQHVIVDSMTAGAYGGQVEGRADDGAVPVGYPVLLGGFDSTSGFLRRVAVDSLGRVIIAPQGSNVSNGFVFGDVAISAIVSAREVRRTTYTEQSSNAQRSVVSANAADTAAGTGARTVKITYYTSAGVGPNTETLTLNGTTPVNTVNTNICFIEKIEVMTVGSGGSNTGIISLKAATAGGGATVWSIGATDNITFGAHHYVPTGKTCYITSVSVVINGGAGIFYLRSLPIGVSNAVEKQISDFIRESAQAATSTRSYGTPIPIVGPARIVTYLNTEANTSLIYRTAFDFFEQ